MEESGRMRDRFFPWEKFLFSVRVTQLMVLPPYKGGIFRGAFGATFRSTVCAFPEKECPACSFGGKCGYASLFEPTPPPDFPDAGKFNSASPPYVLIPPLTTRQAIHPGERLTFEMILMGDALEQFPYVLLSFVELGKRGLGRERGRYFVERVDMIRGEHATLVYDGDSEMIPSAISPRDVDFPADEEDVRDIGLHLITPLRLKEKGKLATSLTFPLFFQRLAQRLTLLSQFHGKNGAPPDLGPLLEKAGNIET
ncbi:MAG: hypothetical protein GY859_01310, partial [Desulfobacterales bacterium]|nr:hypothetical protein [Desulfobacterales bacterium]